MTGPVHAGGPGHTPGAAPGRRVVVTGMEVATALGAGLDATWAGLIGGRSGIRAITRFDPSRVGSRIAGEIPDFDPGDVVDRKEQRRNDRFALLALWCARHALDAAGLPGRLERPLAERTGVIVGSGIGGGATFVEQVELAADRGPDRISPFFIPMVIANLGAGQVGIMSGALGPNFATVSACASGGHAIGEAWETIRRDDADVMIAGGTEAPLSEALVASFAAMRALSTRNDDPAAASRPFDAGRDGFVIAEGAACLILEELGHARRRGAPILAELVGYAATGDASHITLPAPGGEGALRAARRALQKAAMSPDEVDHVNAHATSTPEGDRAELQAIRTLLGERVAEVSVTANKSMIGHTLGAAGAIEAAVTIRSLIDGIVPPTVNLDAPDEAGAGMDLTPREARRRPLRAAVSNSFGFGGQNSALVLRRWEP
ncbi:MAG: beta-ketoacyl-ACP synthase II [Chloroflexi bacterium]|nr:beta-ketoacyl-ACP synthase II [Chloroflexota bacterium]